MPRSSIFPKLSLLVQPNAEISACLCAVPLPATRKQLTACLDAADLVEVVKEPAVACSLPELEELLEQHKPAVLFICQGLLLSIQPSQALCVQASLH